MFGNLGQIAGLLRNAGQLREKGAAAQERLRAARFVGDAGAGQVQATCDGRGELLSLRIEPQLLSAGDAEALEDLVIAAVRDAVSRSREGAAKELEAVTGMNLQGLMDMLGGGPQSR